MASASVVGSKGVPLPVFLKELLASPSASGKTAASGRLVSIARLFADSDSDSEDSSDEDPAAARIRERVLSIAKLFSGDDVVDDSAKLRLLMKEGGGGAASVTGFSPRGWWVSKEDADAVQLKVAMPGLGKEHVKMKAEKDVLVIKGDADGDGGKGKAQYSYRIALSSQAFKMDQIKAEMKNGMLSLTVPKIKDEERKDVFEIKVE